MDLRTPINLREAIARDYPACASIYAEAWNEALPEIPRSISTKAFQNEISGELVFVAAIGKRIAGYISVWKPDWFIHHLYVSPQAQRTGIGTVLLDHIVEMAHSNPVSLKVQTKNFMAAKFYESAGFHQTRERGRDEYGEWIRLIKTA